MSRTSDVQFHQKNINHQLKEQVLTKFVLFKCYIILLLGKSRKGMTRISTMFKGLVDYCKRLPISYFRLKCRTNGYDIVQARALYDQLTIMKS